MLVEFFFSNLVFAMLHQGIFDRQPTFECHFLSYKRVIELTMLCNVNKAQVYIFNVKVKIPVLDLK